MCQRAECGIYDKTTPNYTLSRESKIFLVDQVLVAIEIKTRFTTQSLQEALENTKSVKKLIPSGKTWVEWQSRIDDEKHQSLCQVINKPSPPLSVIFFYTSLTRTTCINLNNVFKTLKNEIDKYERIEQPDLLFSLDHSIFFKHVDMAKLSDGKYYRCSVKLDDITEKDLELTGITPDVVAVFDFSNNEFTDDSYCDGKFILDKTGKPKIIALDGGEINLDPLIYKTCLLDGTTYFIDSYRGFLLFISQIEVCLRVKTFNKNHFIDSYFPEGFFYISEVKNSDSG